jgi:hypothetical protein
MDKEIINKVAQSGIVTLELESFYPKEDIAEIDLKNYLFHGLILKEKDFRESLKETDWSKYSGKIVHVHCSADAIIPSWAFMLLSAYLHPVVKKSVFGDKEDAVLLLMLENLKTLNPEKFTDQRVVIKGCGDKSIPAGIFMEITNLLLPHVKSLMFGEPCSTVPVYKKK